MDHSFITAGAVAIALSFGGAVGLTTSTSQRLPAIEEGCKTVQPLNISEWRGVKGTPREAIIIAKLRGGDYGIFRMEYSRGRKSYCLLDRVRKLTIKVRADIYYNHNTPVFLLAEEDNKLVAMLQYDKG